MTPFDWYRVSVGIVSMLGVWLVGPALTHGASVKVPFLFSEDDKLPQTELHDAIPPSTTVADNQFLNAPLTRLEYMLMQLEAQLNEKLGQDVYVLDVVKKAFDSHQVHGHTSSPRIKGSARYDQKLSRVLVGWTVEELGRPRVPMRTTCDTILNALNRLAPQEMQGYLWHNTALGVLAQRDIDWYTPTLAILARSVVHWVRLQSRTEGFRVTHTLACQQISADAPIVYQRYSFKLRDSR
jgi:hypothetical protein